MLKLLATVTFALLCVTSCTGCPKKAGPTSTTTTRTQTSVDDDDGGRSTSDIKVKETTQADGSKDVERTETTTTTTPPPPPTTPSTP